MDKIKQLNRNPFNEKIIHRYFLETIYMDNDINIKKSLLAKPYKKLVNSINLVIPEESTKAKYRADLSIYFRDQDTPIPVEIKWKADDLIGKNQIAYLKKHGGYLAAFDGIPPKEIDNETQYIKLDESHFRNWLLSRVDALWDDAYATQVKSVNRDNKWLVVLKGAEAIRHFHKMKDSCQKSKAFWAFKNRNKLMRNMLHIKFGDEVYFLLIKVFGGYTSMPEKIDWDFQVIEFYRTRVKKPYYMVIEGDKSFFFEKEPIINKRTWPHFMDFSIESQVEVKASRINSKHISKKLKTKISESHNYGTIPLQLELSEVTELLGLIN